MENKREYTDHMGDLLVDPMISTMISVYAGVQRKTPDRQVLRAFQDALETVPKWNAEQIHIEYKRLKCTYFADLIKATLITYAQMAVVAGGAAPPNVKLTIPTPEHFLHRCYIFFARMLWQHPDIMYHKYAELERQANLNRCDQLVRKAIRMAIRDSIPYELLLKQVVAEQATVDPELADESDHDDEETEEETDEDGDDDESEVEEEEEEEEPETEEEIDDEDDVDDDDDDDDDDKESEPPKSTEETSDVDVESPTQVDEPVVDTPDNDGSANKPVVHTLPPVAEEVVVHTLPPVAEEVVVHTLPPVAEEVVVHTLPPVAEEVVVHTPEKSPPPTNILMNPPDSSIKSIRIDDSRDSRSHRKQKINDAFF